MTTNVPHKTRRLLILSLACSPFLAACGGGDDDDFDDRADVADPKVRFVHAVPSGPAVTLARNGVAESNATNVDYKYGSQYYDVSTGRTVFSLRLASNNTEVATSTFDTNRGNRYTLVALPSGSAGVELLAIDDPYNKSLASDNARVRVVNAAVNAQNLDIYITAPGVDLAGVSPTIAAVGYKQAAPSSTADSITLEGGNYQLRITVAGTKTVIFNNNVAVPRNGDWLLLPIPDDGGIATPNDIRVLLVRSDDTPDATDEITSL